MRNDFALTAPPQWGGGFDTVAQIMSGVPAMTLDCKSVSQLVDESGLSQPLVSHHLRILREAGLAKSGRRGIYMLY